MATKTTKKPPLYTTINELLAEHGESILVAAQNPLFRQRVTEEILELFSPTAISLFNLETTRAVVESFEKGAIDIQEIYLLHDFMVKWHQQVVEEEENLTLHETISFILQSGNVGESIVEACKKLLTEGKVEPLAVSSYR